MKNLALWLLILITGCTSDYQPGEAMLAYKKNLTVEDAVAELQARLWPAPEQSAICASRGFWIDENATFTVLEDKFAMFAYRKGELVRSEGGGFGSTHYYEREYYRYFYPFSDIGKIVIHKRFGLLAGYRGCIKPDETKTYFVIDLYSSEDKNLKFIVYEEQFDETMAVITTLMPDKPVKVNG